MTFAGGALIIAWFAILIVFWCCCRVSAVADRMEERRRAEHRAIEQEWCSGATPDHDREAAW